METHIEGVAVKEDGDDSVLVAGQRIDYEILTSLSGVDTSVHVFTSHHKCSVNSSDTNVSNSCITAIVE